MKTKNKILLLILLLASVVIAAFPLFTLKDAEFGGSDDAGGTMIEEIDTDYDPWFTPVLETMIGGELPGEIESLLFCVQTGIGIGILAFCLGRMYERKKLNREEDAL